MAAVLTISKWRRIKDSGEQHMRYRDFINAV